MSTNPLKPGWSVEPNATDQMYSVPIVRCRKGKPLSVVFLAPMATGRYLHWDGSRTIPCLENDCSFCRRSVRRDWKLYIPIWSPASSKIGMMELPYSALKYFQAHYLRTLTCYGFHAEIFRVGDTDKARVKVDITRKYNGATPLPEAPNAIEYMERVWGTNALPARIRKEATGATPLETSNLGRAPAAHPME